jgi:hypothetical protein
VGRGTYVDRRSFAMGCLGTRGEPLAEAIPCRGLAYVSYFQGKLDDAVRYWEQGPQVVAALGDKVSGQGQTNCAGSRRYRLSMGFLRYQSLFAWSVDRDSAASPSGSPLGTTTPGLPATTGIPGVPLALSHRFRHIDPKIDFYDTSRNAASNVSAAERCMSGVTWE